MKFIIYFRNAQTERDYADQADPNMSLDNYDIAHMLTPDGSGGFTLQANMLPDEWAQL